MRSRQRKKQGFSLIEVLISLSILSVATLAIVSHIVVVSKATQDNDYRIFATQKAIQIFNELKTYAESSGNNANILDQFDDGVTTKPQLTIQVVNSPGDPVSGNIVERSSGNIHTDNRFSRRINVLRVGDSSSRDVRLVQVKIFLTSAISSTSQLLAETWGIIRTAAVQPFPPTQVYDLYAIAIENVPGWWVYMDNLVPQADNAIKDIEARNPGLEFRTHWITKLAYGRDPEYVPFVNVQKDSTQTLPWIYFYPDLMPSGSSTAEYYVNTIIKGRSRVDYDVNQDGSVDGKDIINNFNDTGDPKNLYTQYYDAIPYDPYPYSLADTYNNAMRYPDEQALWSQRYAKGLETELTYRLLLDDLYQNPLKYQNALFINLHGELLPMPPVRNYSDAAKDPEGAMYARVVTHPGQIIYSTTSNVSLRVYAYLTNPSYTGYTNNRLSTITVLIKNPSGITLNPANVSITQIEGGVNPASCKTYTSGIAPSADPGPGCMWATKATVPDGVWVTLYNTPLKAPLDASNKGLPSSAQLYGMEYIPAPVESPPTFANNLTYVSSTAAKNTARWVITLNTLNAEVLPLEIDTRIGTDLSTGTMWPPSQRDKPQDLSKTYTWITNTPAKVPFSEQYQFIGDPRDEPYKDVKQNLGYNWFFTDTLGTGYSGYSPLWKGWDASTAGDGSGSNNMEMDVPRFYQWLRGGLLQANGIWTTINGYSYYYMGMGNEIGYDSANGFPSSIPINVTPFNGNGNNKYEDSITLEGGSFGSGAKMIYHGSSGWYSKPWTGELFRDEDYVTQWKANGNLPAPTYYRLVKNSTSLPASFRFRSARRAQTSGCGSMYNMSNDGGNTRFDHAFSSGTGTMNVSLKTELQNTFNFTMYDTVSSDRPYLLNSSDTKGREWTYAPYSTMRTKGVNLVTLYSHSVTGTASGIIQIYNPTTPTQAAFFAVHGLSQTTQVGSTFISRYALLNLVYTFLRGGGDSIPNVHIPQLSLVTITYPSDTSDEVDNPITMNVTWTANWTRWGGAPYSTFDTFTSSTGEPIFFVLYYSVDGGKTWLYIQDGTPATPGTRPANILYQIDGHTTNYTWNVSNFQEGTYYLRIDAFRTNVLPHYSYHEQSFYIKRD